ncbi:hypothetical protein ACQPYK_05200 [Streptosporangium sp. CA-135522]
MGWDILVGAVVAVATSRIALLILPRLLPLLPLLRCTAVSA